MTSRAARLELAARIATELLAVLPERTFGSGSRGRQLRCNVTLDGVEYFADLRLIDRASVPRDELGRPLSRARRPSPEPVEAAS